MLEQLLHYFFHVMHCISAAYAVMWCLSVHPSLCLSVTFVHSVEMNKRIFNFVTVG